MSKHLIALFLLGLLSQAQDARQLVAESQLRNRSKSQRYEGTLEVVNAKSRVTTKQWEFVRLGAFGDSMATLRFTEPPEVKGVALLIHNHPDRASDQWMWRPQIGRDQRVALQDRSARFFGTDFSFEDLEERDVDQFDYKLAGSDSVDGAACWKLESRPKETKTSQYTSSLIWMRKDNYLVVQIEASNKSGPARRINYRDLENVQGHWTARRIEVVDVKTNSRTILKLQKLQYDVPLNESDFTLQALRRSS